MAESSRRSYTLSPGQRALVTAMLRGDPPPSPERADDGPLPLSFAQERMWFLDQFQPGLSIYNMPFTVRLSHPVQVPALARTLGEIVRRHEILRTTFAVVDGRPAQIVAPAAEMPMPVVDLRGLAPPAREAELQRRFAAEHEHVFDIARGPLVRATLLQMSDADNVLLMNMHHIVSDGWSMSVLMRELAAIYAAFAQGRPSPLPELPVQYATFARQQRERLEGATSRSLLSYWKEQLRGAPSILPLPLDRPRPQQQTFRGETALFTVPAAVVGPLVVLSREAGATLFMALFAAFAALLGRYSGQDQVVVGTPIANRNRTELEGSIGVFVNTLVLRADLSGDPGFRELLGRVREVTLGAYAHQDLPFEALVQELQPERSLAHSPLFQVLFALQNHPTHNAPVSEVPAGEVRVIAGTAKFDLSLYLGQTERGLVGELEYCVDLFDRSTAVGIVRHFLVLLSGIAAAPDRPVSELPLLSAAEERTILGEWNAPRSDAPHERCIHHLFEVEAERSPDVVAVVAGDLRLTYRELDRRAERLARRLRALDVGPGVCIGIHVERSLAPPIAVLGVLKAGGVCVPLDPAHPAERRGFMLADAGARVVVTGRARPDGLAPEIRTVSLDDDDDGACDERPGRQAAPDDLAYVLYTSGSTGTPKGVAMPHRALVHLFARQAAQGARGATTLQFASLGFDVSFQEMFGTWGAGGTLVVADDDARRDPALLLRRLVDARVERAFLPPAVLQQLAVAALAEQSYPTSVREVIAAGEPLKISREVAGLFARIDACVLRNQYGPTETHVVTEQVLCGDPQTWPGLPSIGRPIADARIYVLDRHRRPVPVGVRGELHVGGACVARGYLRRPSLTAERFIPDPFGGPGERLYCTGDLARFRADGTIELLGRTDDQIKLRGHRIEPGEVEEALRDHPSVREAVVVARDVRSGDRRLVAYVVPAPGRSAEVGDLRRALGRRLPEAMIPSIFVALDALPLTPNRKVDRRALPDPDAARVPAARAPVAPRYSIETTIAEIWRVVLGVDRVGVHDNFFELGGHSLLAAQIVARVRDAYGVSVPLRRVFEAPSSVADLAVAVLEGLAAGRDREELDRMLTEIERGAAEPRVHESGESP